ARPLVALGVVAPAVGSGDAAHTLPRGVANQVLPTRRVGGLWRVRGRGPVAGVDRAVVVIVVDVVCVGDRFDRALAVALVDLAVATLLFPDLRSLCDGLGPASAVVARRFEAFVSRRLAVGRLGALGRAPAAGAAAPAPPRAPGAAGAARAFTAAPGRTLAAGIAAEAARKERAQDGAQDSETQAEHGIPSGGAAAVVWKERNGCATVGRI